MSHDSWSISLFVRLLFVCVLLYIPRRVSCYPPRWIGLMWRHRCNLITIYTGCPKKTLELSDYFYIFIDPCGIFYQHHYCRMPVLYAWSWDFQNVVNRFVSLKLTEILQNFNLFNKPISSLISKTQERPIYIKLVRRTYYVHTFLNFLCHALNIISQRRLSIRLSIPMFIIGTPCSKQEPSSWWIDTLARK